MTACDHLRSALAALAVLAAAPVAATPLEPSHALLERMARSVREANYAGVFTYEQGQDLSSARIVHAVVDGVQRERLQQLDGAERQFLRIAHPLDCKHPAHRLFGPFASARLDSDPEAYSGRLAGHYVLEAEGGERVASREGQRLRLSPRDRYRYGMTLVLDGESALPLRAETTDAAGRVLERFQFVELRTGAEVDAAEVLGDSSGAHIEAEHPETTPDAFDWSVSWLPAGFVESARETRRDRDRAVEVRHFSDGLAAFGVFVEPAASDVAAPGQALQGATVAYVLPRPGGGVVTVVGEIPPDTARLVANAVSFPAP